MATAVNTFVVCVFFFSDMFLFYTSIFFLFFFFWFTKYWRVFDDIFALSGYSFSFVCFSGIFVRFREFLIRVYRFLALFCFCSPSFFVVVGAGKTLIGKAIAHQSGATFFSISASSLCSKWIGEGEKMVRTLFAVASYHQACFLFVFFVAVALGSFSLIVFPVGFVVLLRVLIFCCVFFPYFVMFVFFFICCRRKVLFFSLSLSLYFFLFFFQSIVFFLRAPVINKIPKITHFTRGKLGANDTVFCFCCVRKL